MIAHNVKSTPCAQRELDSGAATKYRLETIGDDLHKIWPLIYDNQSDSASFDMRWNCWSTAATRSRTR